MNEPDKPAGKIPGWTEMGVSPDSGTPWRLWHLLYLILVVAVVFWLLITYQGFVVPFILVMAAACSIGAGVIIARGRASQQDSLLWMLSIAADHGMPLATTVAAFANQYSGRYRRRVLRLAALLEQGASLPDALANTPRVVSRDALLLIRMGHENGRLGQSLRTAASVRAGQAPIWANAAARVSYLLGLLLAIQLICGFVMYFIIPKFEAIFNDFGVSLPNVSIALIIASHFYVKYLLWLPLLTLFLFLYVPFSIAGWSNFDVPLFARFVKRRHSALILRALGLVVESGRPIEQGMHTLASHYPTRWGRRKLAAAARQVHEGIDWRKALLGQGLIREADAEVLSSASAVGNLPWAMSDLAESAERRQSVRFNVLIQTLFPIVILAFGALVLFMAVGFFGPLVELIGRLSG